MSGFQWIGLGLVAAAIVWGYRMVTRKHPELKESPWKQEEENSGS